FFEDFRAESRKLLDDFGPETVRPWRYEGRQFVAFRNDRLLVLGLGLSTYAGGAHGMHGVRYAIIDVRENRLLSPRDAFVPGCDEKLSDLLDAKVRGAFGFEPGASLAASKLFLTDRIPPTNNFFVFGGGVGFHYNAYEIAPYSTGDVWVEIRWDELGDCLAPGFRERYGF
ncbi:MAG: DUF3298 domain-containing protein, partial [Spirochaetaceae bacterium]|nr:DUF3298 domain-containing protein [Spirochaetaceae bacterium]